MSRSRRPRPHRPTVMPPPAQAYLTLEDAHAYCGLTVRELRTLCRLRRLRFSKPSKTILVRREWLERCIEQYEVRRPALVERAITRRPT